MSDPRISDRELAQINAVGVPTPLWLTLGRRDKGVWSQPKNG
jgi:hypothetical protein